MLPLRENALQQKVFRRPDLFVHVAFDVAQIVGGVGQCRKTRLLVGGAHHFANRRADFAKTPQCLQDRRPDGVREKKPPRQIMPDLVGGGEVCQSAKRKKARDGVERRGNLVAVAERSNAQKDRTIRGQIKRVLPVARQMRQVVEHSGKARQGGFLRPEQIQPPN